jgi:hypothetical protein
MRHPFGLQSQTKRQTSGAMGEIAFPGAYFGQRDVQHGPLGRTPHSLSETRNTDTHILKSV